MDHSGWFLAHSNTVQMMIFLGSILFLGVMETWIPMSRSVPDRKRRWTVNYTLTFLAFLIPAFVPLSTYQASLWAMEKGIGLFHQMPSPILVVLLATMAGRGLASWVLHIFMHKIPALWRLHRIHHLDDRMDISTTVRFHPVEILMSIGVGIVVVALLGIPIWALATYEILESTVRLFSHANIRLPESIDKTLRMFISTPAMHRIHHSVLRSEMDSNYGTILSVWDRLFRTYLSPAGKDLPGMALGLKVRERSKIQSFGWLLRSPWLDDVG